MLYCVYITIYRGKDLPPFYIGSSNVEKIKKGYKGSISSKEYKEIWNTKIKFNPELFITKIISLHETRKEAFEKEHLFHKKLNVIKNPLYINKAFANGSGRFGGGFLGKKHSKERNDNLSKQMKGRKNYWTPKSRPEHAEKMKGNQFNKGKKYPEHAEKMKGNQFGVGYWWTNGFKNTKVKECPGVGWISGMTRKNKLLTQP